MARKKKPDEPAENGSATGAAVADPPMEATAPERMNGAQSAGQPPAEESPKPAPPNRPAASFAANSDRGTRIEVAVWAKQVKVSEQEEYTQYSLTLSRAWRDQDGNWRGNGSFRIHDVPVLLYLVQQAYHWCLAQRTHVRIESAEPLPF